MPDNNERFYGAPMAKVVWRAEDVQSLRPGWALERCEQELGAIEKYLRDRLTELGWEVMEDLLPVEQGPFEVATLMLGGEWTNCWTETVDGVERALTFATRAEAQAGLDEHCAEMQQAGMDYDPDGYQIRPVPPSGE